MVLQYAVNQADLSNLPPGARLVETTVIPTVVAGEVQAPSLSFLNKLKSFTLAMASKALQPAASRAQRRARLATCAGCNAFKPTGDYRVGFCGACGCGQSNPLATLAVKSKILRSSCPRNLWDAAISLPILPPAPPEV
jgi:hypothetical protein